MEEKKYEHWRMGTDLNYLRAELLLPGQDLVLTIKEVDIEEIKDTKGEKALKRVAHFVEPDVKPMVLNTTNCKTIAKVLNSDNIYDWLGKKIQIFSTTVKVGGEVVPCLRIRPTAPAKSAPEYKCAVCGKILAKEAYDYSMSKYGKAYCGKECLEKDKEGK